MKIYRFDHFKDFFSYQLSRSELSAANKKNETLRRLIKKLGYNSPSLLSMIAKGQRLPSAALLESLLDNWQIPQTEREAIRVQVEIERRLKNDKDVLHLLDRLKKIQGTTQYRQLDLEQFQVIRHWYVYVLKELVGTKDFTEDPLVLSRLLRNKVSPAQIKKGLNSLLTTGLIKRNPETGKLESAVTDTETSNGIPSEAIQEHHRSMLERAMESIKEQKVPDRHLNSLTLRFDPKKSAVVGAKIFEFMKKMNEEYQDPTSENVFQLNVQFFEHTNLDKIRK